MRIMSNNTAALTIKVSALLEFFKLEPTAYSIETH
jgi:hypothetical protein